MTSKFIECIEARLFYTSCGLWATCVGGVVGERSELWGSLGRGCAKRTVGGWLRAEGGGERSERRGGGPPAGLA